MKIKIQKIFSLLLFISSLASGMEQPGRKATSEGEMKKVQQLQEAARARLKTAPGNQELEEENEGCVDLRERFQIEAAEPIIVSSKQHETPNALLNKDRFEQERDQIDQALTRYTREASKVLAHHALDALSEASWRAKVNLDDIEHPVVQANFHQQKMIELHHAMALVYKSIASDYMDAAEAENTCDKNSKPYLEAIGIQQRILNCLNELKEQMEEGRFTSANEAEQAEQIKELRGVTRNVRTMHSIGIEDSSYAGSRFFSEMPH